MNKGHDEDLESEEVGFVSRHHEEEYDEDYGPKFNWGVCILMGLIGFEGCLVLHILFNGPQSYLIYIIRLIGIGLMLRYSMMYLMSYILVLFPHPHEDKKDVKFFLAYIATSAAFFAYDFLIFLFHPKWLLTNWMNNSLEINYLKFYPHIMLISWVVLRAIRRHSYQQRKGLHYY